jgi:hypothetical protein
VSADRLSLEVTKPEDCRSPTCCACTIPERASLADLVRQRSQAMMDMAL